MTPPEPAGGRRARRVALVNPSWDFHGSIYFGCREPHLPLELAYAQALLARAGHQALLVDAHLHALSRDEVRRRVADFAPDLTAFVTAPTYLFWRCPPPELRVPLQTARDLRGIGGALVAVGPHGSTTPRATSEKLGVDACVLGECEEVLVALAGTPREDWGAVPSVALRTPAGAIAIHGTPAAADMAALPALRWPAGDLARKRHHHHRFDAEPRGPGAELEASRGCPYHCTFCNKETFRDAYRKRPLPVVLEELDALIAQGAEYVYFVDEIFLPDRPLLEALCERPISFGVQMRIDVWSREMLDLLGRAGCKSIEAGVESVSVAGRKRLMKRCALDNDELADLLIHVKRSVPFVQANLLAMETDDPGVIEAWREQLARHGVWANKPVPLFPYPGTPDYRLRWGLPDDRAWERAHEHYLASFSQFSDIQEARPLPLAELERVGDG